MEFTNKKSISLIFSFLLIMSLLGCGKSERHLRIGCKNFTEQLILGEIIAQTIEQKNPEIQIEKKWGFGSTPLIHQALIQDEIDLYLEYTGTAEQLILKSEKSLSPDELNRLYHERFHLRSLPSLGFSNGYALIVRSDSTLPQKLSACGNQTSKLKAGFNAEFISRPDGFPLFKAHYPLNFASIINLDVGLLYIALKEGKVDLISGFTTDAQLSLPDYRILEDDLHHSPRYEPVPLIREEILLRYPTLEKTLHSLSGLLNESAMQRLNAEVELQHRSPQDVAKDVVKKHFNH